MRVVHVTWQIALLALLALAQGCRNDASTASPAPAESGAGSDDEGSPSPGRLTDELDSGDPSGSDSGGVIGIPLLVDVAKDVGVEFVLDNGHSPAMLMMQSTSGGVSWLDLDADGWLDLYFAQGGNPFGGGAELRPCNDVLFRSLAGKQFVDVSPHSIPTDDLFGHGVVAGDFDNDGFDDLYISNVGPDLLYHNLGDGTFENVTESAGIDCPLWSSSAAWYDLDLDGDLDLYVCTYVDYDPLNPIDCLDGEESPGICHPREVDAVPDQCYFNQGDGTFLEESEARGLVAPEGKSLGVVVSDMTGDGLPDVFVANDTTASHLFVNQGSTTFVERGHAMGCAMSGLGQYQANMGVGYGDYDENGYADLYITTFTADSNTLFAGHGEAGFKDVTRERGLHHPTMDELGFGTVMSDFDFNGRQDIYIANGHIDDWREDGDMWYMPAQLFTYDGEQWHDVSDDAGEFFERETLSRAVATADYDRDGDADLAVVHQNEVSSLLRNDSEKGHWLQLQFLGHESNRRGVGTRVTLVQGERRLVQDLAGGTSYCAGHQQALFFGLGDADAECELTIEWSSGRREELKGVKVDQILVLNERDAEAP